MRVALLLDRFPVTSETFVTTGISGLLRAGCDVTVVARRRPREGLVHPEHRALGLVERTTYVDSELAPDDLGPRTSVPLEPGCYDVLHAHFGSNARHYLFARAQARAPLVATFHGYDFSADPRTHGREMYEALFRTADVITYNARHARAALEALGCPLEKLRLARMPVDVSSFTVRERRWDGREPVRFATVGRLVEKKGHELTVHALAAARDRLPAFRYDVVGDGPLAPRIERLVGTLGLAEIVRFHGAADSGEVRALLDRAHVFVLGSTTAASGDVEGTPISLMEAQACGLPVVTTRHGGIEEVVLDGRSGFLVEEGDRDALAAAVIRMVAARDAWPALGAAGRAHVERSYDVGVCTEQMLGAYRAAARRFGRDARQSPL
jgi:colanic acid/amylovoran biosynthesis glycosyltransferase